MWKIEYNFQNLGRGYDYDYNTFFFDFLENFCKKFGDL